MLSYNTMWHSFGWGDSFLKNKFQRASSNSVYEIEMCSNILEKSCIFLWSWLESFLYRNRKVVDYSQFQESDDAGKFYDFSK